MPNPNPVPADLVEPDERTPEPEPAYRDPFVDPPSIGDDEADELFAAAHLATHLAIKRLER